MGFFSWKTSDTKVSIPNKYQQAKPTFKVHMITSDGRVFTEPCYEGYGEFGGKDFYELLAELNGVTTGSTDFKRLKGIDMFFKDNPSGDPNCCNLDIPKLVQHLPSDGDIVGLFNKLPHSESCEYQGFFYDEDDEDYYL